MICQSPAANVVGCARAIPVVSNATLNQHRTVPIISALGYQKIGLISIGQVDHRLSPSAETCELVIDLLIFRVKNRKCFCLLDVSAALGLRCSCWVGRRYLPSQVLLLKNFQNLASGA